MELDKADRQRENNQREKLLVLGAALLVVLSFIAALLLGLSYIAVAGFNPRNGLACPTDQTVVLYVGDTTTIMGRFVACQGDYFEVVGKEPPSAVEQHYWVRSSAIKMFREVPK